MRLRNLEDIRDRLSHIKWCRSANVNAVASEALRMINTLIKLENDDQLREIRRHGGT